MGFGDQLKKIRNEHGLRQEDIGKIVHVGKSTVSQWESNIHVPDLETVTKIANHLNVSIDYLLGQTDDPRPVDEITDAHRRIEEALTDDPEADELLGFWKDLKEREDLFLLFKQVRPLSDDSIRRVIRVIKAIEDEEAKEFRDGF